MPMQVRLGPSGCWQLDEGGGGYGCEPGEEGVWSPARYRHVRGARAAGGPAFHRDPPATLPKPMLRVRHAADPLVAAHNLTQDEMHFGASDGLKVLGGLELLITASVLALAPLCFFFRSLRKAKARRGRDRGGDFTRVPEGQTAAGAAAAHAEPATELPSRTGASVRVLGE